MKKVYLIQNEMWEWVVICEGKQIFNGGAFRTVDFALLNLYIRAVTATMLDDFLNWL